MRRVRDLAAIGLVLWGGLVAVSSAHARPDACRSPGLGLPLAGPGVVDCGVAELGQARARARVEACARRAIDAGKPVRFGIAINRYDEFLCDVVVADVAQRYWLITLHWSTSILAEHPPRAFVGRCPAVNLDRKDPEGRGRWYGPQACVEDLEAFERAGIRIP